MAIKLKALGLALAAAFALSAVAASAASADEVHSGSASGFTYATAEFHTTNFLETPSGNIKCIQITGHVKYTGTTATEATFTNLAYDTCTAFGLTAHIDTMGCIYTLTGVTATTGVAHLVCPETAGGVKHSITITTTQGGVSICHLNVPAQSVNVTISNRVATAGGIPDDIDITPDPKQKITYISERTSTTICPTTGHHEDAFYKGTITGTGFQDATHTERVGLTYT
jgi:hypothetical protein